jgi:hypothetical protein
MANLQNFKVFNEWYTFEELLIDELVKEKIYQIYSNKNSPYRISFINKLQLPIDPQDRIQYLESHSIEITNETIYFKCEDSPKTLYIRNSSGWSNFNSVLFC